MKLIVACATDNGHSLTGEHFGSARNYAVYELDGQTCTPLPSVSNTSRVEKEGHGSAQKARSVTKILEERQVQVVVAKHFGPNISRIKTSFVPIIFKIDTLEEVCRKLVEHRETILTELQKGEHRGFLLLA